jgi:carboxyl-terminal processing protease
LEDYTHRAQVAGTWRVPLIVLIDQHSASASEIFAAAIRDHKRGIVVGSQSYGKGSVQGIFPLNVSNGGIRLTTAKFYSPNGQAISHGGVIPDVPVETVAKPTTDEPMESMSDPILEIGVNVAYRDLENRRALAGR